VKEGRNNAGNGLETAWETGTLKTSRKKTTNKQHKKNGSFIEIFFFFSSHKLFFFFWKSGMWVEKFPF
jgi:hypothetical protein